MNRETEIHHLTSCGTITYGAVLDAIEATESDPFEGKIVDPVEWAVIAQCVNQGIDSHLEAIVDAKEEFNDGRLSITPVNLCIFLRRLGDTNFVSTKAQDKEFAERVRRADIGEEATTVDLFYDAAYNLQSNILLCLGFNESGVYVGREALGLD